MAKDERGSSLHEISENFVTRFGFESLRTARTIDVRLTTLDECLKENLKHIDCIDINAEGHDFQVLEGATKLFQGALVKLVKIEFELTGVWHKQGWFSDIDAWMRNRNFELANIDIEFLRPMNSRNIKHSGEPLWGKAYYVPGLPVWQNRGKSGGLSGDDIVKSVVLLTMADLPGRAMDVLEYNSGLLKISNLDSQTITDKIVSTFRFYYVDKIIDRLRGLLPGTFN